MVAAALIGAGAGALLGGGLGALTGDSQRSSDRFNRDIGRSLEATLRAALANDPLQNQILGGLSSLQGTPFNADKIFEAGTDQLEQVRKRREFDAQRSLAAQGFGVGSRQEDFIGKALGQQVGLETQGLRGLVDQAAIQARPQSLLDQFGLFTGLLGQQLGTGASLGALGQRADRGPAFQSGGEGLPNVDGGQAQSFLPPGLQSNFFVS